MNSYTKAFTYDTAGNITKESTYAYTTGPVGNPFPAPPSGSPAWCYLTPTLLGDANCDGVVSMADVTAINNYLVGLGTLTNQGMKNADVNYSHTVNSADAGAIQSYLVQTGTLPPTASPNKVVEYTYSTGQWKDQLTGIATKTYNSSGTLTSTVTSPTVTYNADGNMTKIPGVTQNAVWKGNQLDYVDTSVARQYYSYDKNGLRIEKIDWDGDTGWRYYYSGGQLERMEGIGYSNGNITMAFAYDAAGKPWIMDYFVNGTPTAWYFFEYNAQGDVIGLLNSSNVRVVEYRYDAWGKPLSVTGSLAGTIGQYNPFRYRAYVWDNETGFYYLKSRY
ncbi:MAG: dockerin type I domain-containing protein [Clostridiales bacterium]|nr:dockerin type I domain-containing protein [Clostridiales bacterium]